MSIIKKVSLLTGFLGAGKTTLLNEIILQRKELRFAVLENEVGAQSIDAELIIKGEGPVIELNDGCLCCSLNEDIFEVLNQLWDKRSLWDHLLIEATGIADPANIAHPFLTNPNVQKGFSLQQVICVVDAQLIEDQLKETQEAIQQISFSDVILLNKVEQVFVHYANEVVDKLKLINPFAEILVRSRENFNTSLLFKKENTSFFKPKVNFLPVKGVVNLSSVSAMGPLKNIHTRHQHSDIETVLLCYGQDFDITLLRQRLLVFLILQSSNVYRIKGIVASKGASSKMVVQTVSKSVSITEGETWEKEAKRESKIVIIGRNLQSKGLDKMFRACLAEQSMEGAF
jgi:G3E family GTPase